MLDRRGHARRHQRIAFCQAKPFGEGGSESTSLLNEAEHLRAEPGHIADIGGPRVGAATYNVAHAAILPMLLGIIGMAAPSALAMHLALIWSAHIGLDRALGYGLKYNAGFSFTHLGRIGKTAG